jgi:hypothetical protein
MSKKEDASCEGQARWDCNLSAVALDAMKCPQEILATLIQGAVPEVVALALERRNPAADLVVSLSIAPRMMELAEERARLIALGAVPTDDLVEGELWIGEDSHGHVVAGLKLDDGNTMRLGRVGDRVRLWREGDKRR